MKQYKIVQAYDATETLANNENLTNKNQWDIYNLRKTLRPHIEFQEERISKLNEKYIPFADEQGVLRGEKYSEYLKEQQDLQNMEIEYTFEKIKLPLNGINFKTIEALEDFVEFNL